MENNTKQLKYTLILAIFLISIYIGIQINFYNNDDWVHYKTVENFLSNNFSLHPYIGSTFYSQGVIAYLFAKIFGIARLPVLTILISLINVFVFYRILNLLPVKNRFIKITTVALFALNPLYTYSSIGFMTENYVIFFMLIAIYFQFKYMYENKLSSLALSTIFIIIGFFVKQYSLFLSFSTIAYLAIKKRWKTLFAYYHIPVIIFLFYTFLFPKTEILSEQSVDILLLLDYKRTLIMVCTLFLYLCFFTLPLSIIFGLKTKANRIITAILFIVIMFIQLEFLSSEDFPSLTNVFSRKGIFQDIDGNKSHWAGYYKFFTYSFYLSVTASSLVLSKLILNIKNIFKQNKFILLSFAVYFSLCLILPMFYDRYILPLFIIWLIFLYKHTATLDIPDVLKRVTLVWLIIFTFLSYLFTTEYIVRNIAIANATNELISQGFDPGEILANRAWNNYHDINPNDARFVFHHDRPEKFDEFENTTLEKAILVEFPFSLFINKEIFLYRLQE